MRHREHATLPPPLTPNVIAPITFMEYGTYDSSAHSEKIVTVSAHATGMISLEQVDPNVPRYKPCGSHTFSFALTQRLPSLLQELSTNEHISLLLPSSQSCH